MMGMFFADVIIHHYQCPTCQQDQPVIECNPRLVECPAPCFLDGIGYRGLSEKCVKSSDKNIEDLGTDKVEDQEPRSPNTMSTAG